MSWLNPKDFGKYSRCRNNLLASLLLRTAYVEKMGSGVRRINQELSTAGLPVAEFDYDEYNFSCTFISRSEQAHEQSSILSEGLSEGLKKLLKAVQDSPGIQAKDLAQRLNRPVKTIDRQIKTLTDKDLIERRGSKKTGGYWVANLPSSARKE